MEIKGVHFLCENGRKRMNKLTTSILQNKINFNEVIVNDAAQKYFMPVFFRILSFNALPKKQNTDCSEYSETSYCEHTFCHIFLL